MKRKLIALAVASLVSGAAFAQTNVTVYGVVDAAYVYSSGSAGKIAPVYDAAGVLQNPLTAGTKIAGRNTFSGIAGGGGTAGNRLGFKGEEALGNGLKAVFTLEYGLNIDDNSGVGNTGGLNARQQFVGLSSARLGTLALGRQYAPGFDATANNDALEATDMSIQSSLSALAGDTITPNSNARFDNAITYTSNNMAGFTVKAIYGFGESKVALPASPARPALPAFGTTPASPASAAVPADPSNGTYNNKVVSVSDDGKYGLGLNYANGPINLDAVFQARVNVVVPSASVDLTPPPYKAPGSNNNINEWYIGGSYDFKVVKLYASYQGLDNDNRVVYNGIEDNNLWTVGISAPIGASGTLGLSYGQLAIDRRNSPDGDSWGAGVMYQYNLSKRTALYGMYSYFSNDKYSIPGQAIIVPGVVGAPDESNYALGAGIRHSF